jgi:hypothetical protein
VAEDAFKSVRDAAIAAGGITATTPGTCEVGRGIADLQIGTGTSVAAQFADMITKMKTQIITQLGLTGVANADAMANALIIQLGQDNEEFRALINDIQAESLDFALNYDYSTGAAAVSSVGEQSTTRLASVDVTFDKGELKGNKVYEQYRKDENGIA